MKTVYIVFVSSNYVTGSLIRMVTGWQYNHVALALNPLLPKMHAYSRCNYFEPLNGGYQQETPARYLVDGNDSKIKICGYQVTDEHYARICATLQDYQAHQTETRYNFADILIFPLHKHIPLQRTHTCISFLCEVLELNRYMTVVQLERKLRNQVLYEGSIGAWVGQNFPSENTYFEHRGRLRACKDTTRKNLRLWRDVALIGLSVVFGIELF